MDSDHKMIFEVLPKLDRIENKLDEVLALLRAPIHDPNGGRR
jgi:hypothetical protein